MIVYDVVRNGQDLEEIISLQSDNIPARLTAQEIESQGFVTVVHTLELLSEMNERHPHIVARKDGHVIGYALVMTIDFAADIPVLIPMFERIKESMYQGMVLSQTDYVVMGQICVAKPFRGQGIFRRLYNKMKIELSPYYQLIITEVDIANLRSVLAHRKIGFQSVAQYQAGGKQWDLLAWDLLSAPHLKVPST